MSQPMEKNSENSNQPAVKEDKISDLVEIANSTPPKIEESLHGEWLIVKKKNRRSWAINADKGGSDMKGKNHSNEKERNSKSHAVRDSNKSHVNLATNRGGDEGPA